MPSAYRMHSEFGYFSPTPYRHRELRIAIVSILFGAIIGVNIATLRAGHDRNPDGVSTAAHVDVSNSERVLVAAAEATRAAPNDADTKAETKESIKPFPIRRVRVRPAVPNPPIPTVVEIMPLQSYKHAEFCANELAGVVIPDEHLRRMQEAGERGIDVGFELAHRFLIEVYPRCQGVLLVPSFHRYEMVAELVRETVRLREAARVQAHP